MRLPKFMKENPPSSFRHRTQVRLEKEAEAAPPLMTGIYPLPFVVGVLFEPAYPNYTSAKVLA